MSSRLFRAASSPLLRRPVVSAALPAPSSRSCRRLCSQQRRATAATQSETMTGNGTAANGAANGAHSLHDEHSVVLVLDYGSQYTQLICRRIREIGVFSMMFPGDADMVGARAAAAKNTNQSSSSSSSSTHSSSRGLAHNNPSGAPAPVCIRSHCCTPTCFLLLPAGPHQECEPQGHHPVWWAQLCARGGLPPRARRLLRLLQGGEHPCAGHLLRHAADRAGAAVLHATHPPSETNVGGRDPSGQAWGQQPTAPHHVLCAACAVPWPDTTAVSKAVRQLASVLRSPTTCIHALSLSCWARDTPPGPNPHTPTPACPLCSHARRCWAAP